MKQITQHNRTGEVKVEEVPLPALKQGHLLVQTRFSVISAGTEKSSISQRKSSLIHKARVHPELVLKVLAQVRQYGLLATYRRAKARLETAAPLGYSASGTVIAVGGGVTDLKPGDRVACAGGGYASHGEYMLIPENLCAKVPRAVELDEAAYATLGAIALQGVRQAHPTLGEIVVVIGLGLVGQLTLQLLKANGCSVIGIDLDPKAVKLAKQCGADAALQRTADDVKNVVRSLTKGVGADAVMITAATPSNDPVELAGELCRDKGRVVLVGDVGLHLPRAPYYLKELDVRLSRSYGPGRYDSAYEEQGQDYPIGYVRWTEHRNLQEFLRLLATRAVDVKKLTTHRYMVEAAPSAYALITGGKTKKREHYIGILLDYGDHGTEQAEALAQTIEVSPAGGTSVPIATRVGFLGAGNFAQGFLLPQIQRAGNASLVGVCTANGLNATNVARNFGFQFAATDRKEILEQESINTVFIATRHNLHAAYAVEALKAGKHVFIEKPLALNAEELKAVQKAYKSVISAKGASPPHQPQKVWRGCASGADNRQSIIVMVGFNRRFAPHAQHVKRFFEKALEPYTIQYRVNAGFVPHTHWTRDPVEGGGRILGEVCHFVDLMQYLTDSTPLRIYAESLSSGGDGSAEDDSVVVTLKFRNGSVGTITYLANGDPSLPKERLEISSTGRSAVIDNFQRLSLYQQGKKREFKLSSVDKGHRDEVRAFLQAIQNGDPSPIPFESLVATTVATFRILESLQTGVPVAL